MSYIIDEYKDLVSRPIKFTELCLILARFDIMMKEHPIEEFIEQEDLKRKLF